MSLDFQRYVKRVFGEDALDWFDRRYVVDWAIVSLIWVLVFRAKHMPVTERSFVPSDPELNHPHHKNQVSSYFNQFIALAIPAAVIVAVGIMKRSLMDVHHGIVGLIATRGLASLITDFFKHRIGRLRPDFMSRCKWDEILLSCTGKVRDIIDGRKSFPSGHSTTAFSGMFYLSLFIAGQTAAWCFHVNHSSPRFLSSRFLRFVLTAIPITWAAHVALSRMEDNRHHKEDVIAGSSIGIMSAFVCYLIFWSNPFSSSNFASNQYGQPRSIYEGRNVGRVEFELAPMDDDNTNAV